MKSILDHYSLRARAFPVYVTISPAALTLAAILPDGLNLPLGSGATIVFLPLSFLLGQVGADYGKRLEKRLWRQWGGAPTTRFLRHSNHEFNSRTRGRIHDKLRSLGLPVPSKDEEDNDAQAADTCYESCTEELIRRTRDHVRFPLVFKGLTEYGVRRNLLGLKPLGLLIIVVSFLLCALFVGIKWNENGELAIAIVATLLVAGLFLTWVTWISKRTVSLAANRYARFLLEAALELE